ncbi:MAG: GxxExxY protein [Gemmatimonadota bacterium]|nr:GxxExxY protein [Gemmatimonadota bacterium]
MIWWGFVARFYIMAPGKLFEETLTRSVIGAFYEVYNHLGFGFLEHLYVSALERELLDRKHDVMRECSIHVMYKGRELGIQRLDMIVDRKLVVETKSSSELHKSATRQLYNYLHATNLEVGLLLHFGPRPTFHRVICTHSKYNPEHPSLPEHPYNPPS